MAKVGVLALQGAFREHREVLHALGCEAIEVRVPGRYSVRMKVSSLAYAGCTESRMALTACARRVALSASGTPAVSVPILPPC